MKDDNSVNDYMTVVRMLTSENKYDVRIIQNDIIIYVEAATLPYETCVLLTNDNLFYNSIGRYPVVLKCVIECAREAVNAYNKAHGEFLTYRFQQYPVFSLLDLINDFPVLYNVEKGEGNWGN